MNKSYCRFILYEHTGTTVQIRPGRRVHVPLRISNGEEDQYKSPVNYCYGIENMLVSVC